jgi:uncharacterized membrane protein YjgN (DUF898 family)
VGAAALGGGMSEPSRRIRLQFTGRGSEYFRIWIVGALLSLLTLGVYSAWAKVRSQQYLYRHTWLDGTSFEYLAEPRELLRGRLLLASVLSLVFAVQVLFAPASVFVLLLLLAATPWVVVRSVAFRAKSSAFRNVRFGFAAPLRGAYGAYFKGYLSTLVTLGLAYPGARWRQLAYVVPRLRYGSVGASWTTPRADYYAAYFRGGLLLAPALVLIVAMRRLRIEALSGTPALLSTYACVFLATVSLRAQSANLLYGGVRIGMHVLHSRQRLWPLVLLYVTNTLAVVGTLGLAIPWAKVRLTRYRVERLVLEVRGGLDVTAAPDPSNGRGYGDAAADLGGIDLGIG